MTRVKDNPMDESANPMPRPAPDKVNKKKKTKGAETDEKNAKGKTDASAFDARNNNMTKKG
jgi:hypothetical protein